VSFTSAAERPPAANVSPHSRERGVRAAARLAKEAGNAERIIIPSSRPIVSPFTAAAASWGAEHPGRDHQHAAGERRGGSVQREAGDAPGGDGGVADGEDGQRGDHARGST
jgi:hypothetical protein